MHDMSTNDTRSHVLHWSQEEPVTKWQRVQSLVCRVNWDHPDSFLRQCGFLIGRFKHVHLVVPPCSLQSVFAVAWGMHTAPHELQSAPPWWFVCPSRRVTEAYSFATLAIDERRALRYMRTDYAKEYGTLQHPDFLAHIDDASKETVYAWVRSWSMRTIMSSNHRTDTCPTSPRYQPDMDSCPTSPRYQPDMDACPTSPGYQPDMDACPTSPGYQPDMDACPTSPCYQPDMDACPTSPCYQPDMDACPTSPRYQPDM